MSFFRIAVALGAIVLPLEHARAASLQADFNGDGYADLAIGVEGEDIGADTDAGSVQVIYGTRKGLTARSNQLLDQDSPGMKDTTQPDDTFGRTIAVGDFNADGFADLVVGSPGEEIGGALAAGAVHVIPGSKKGLSTKRSQFWHQDSDGVADAAETKDYFGNALVTGDFDADGYDDLAIGAPAETIEPAVPAAAVPTRAGVVHVLYGGSRGLSSTHSDYWRQGADGVPGAAEAGDRFGGSLAAGDFDADGFADLAVAAPFEDDDGDPSLVWAGVVHILRGSADGVTSANNQLWEQDTPGLAATVEPYAMFGAPMEAGDFNADGYGDLALRVRADVGGAIAVGAMYVLYGDPVATGLRAAGHTYLTQDTPGVQGQATTGDTFGVGITSGDLNGDGFDDLVLGNYTQKVSGIEQAGAVHVFSGSPTGLNGQDGQPGFDDQLFDRASPDVEGAPSFHGHFGVMVAAHDFNGDGLADLAVGVGEGAGDGGVQVFYGQPLGLSFSTDYTWTQDSPHVVGTSEGGDLFGFSLAR